MSITYQTSSAATYSAINGTSISVSYPAGSVEGEKLIMIIGMKPSTANSGSVTTPSGWTAVTSLVGAGGYGDTLGADTGNTNLFAFERTVPAGGLSGSLAVTVATNNVCWGLMFRLSGGAGSAWSVAGTTGSDTTAGNVSITFGADPGVTTGDMIIAGMCIPTDVTTPVQFSAEALTQTGVTFGTVTEDREPDSTTGNDIGGFICHASVSSGTGSAAPTLTATAGGTTTNVRGPGIFIRVREIPATPLTGGNSEGTATSSADAISQTHVTTGGSSEETATSSAGTITQTHVLTGGNSEQANLSSSGSIQVAMPVDLTGGNSEQTNESSAGAIVQTHLLSGGNSQQDNTSSAGGIGQTHALSGGNSRQDSDSSAGAITLTAVLTGGNSEQSNDSSAGSITQTHILTGGNSQQSNDSSAGALTFGVDLTGGNSSQDNISSSAQITQTHILRGNYVDPGYVDPGYVESSDVQQNNQSFGSYITTQSPSASGINRLEVARLQALSEERRKQKKKAVEEKRAKEVQEAIEFIRPLKTKKKTVTEVFNESFILTKIPRIDLPQEPFPISGLLAETETLLYKSKAIINSGKQAESDVLDESEDDEEFLLLLSL